MDIKEKGFQTREYNTRQFEQESLGSGVALNRTVCSKCGWIDGHSANCPLRFRTLRDDLLDHQISPVAVDSMLDMLSDECTSERCPTCADREDCENPVSVVEEDCEYCGAAITPNGTDHSASCPVVTQEKLPPQGCAEYVTDYIGHPSHYAKADIPSGIECWDHYELAMTEEEFRGAMKNNIYKYIFRAGRKDPAKTVEDLKKARSYLTRWIQYAEGDRTVWMKGRKNGT